MNRVFKTVSFVTVIAIISYIIILGIGFIFLREKLLNEFITKEGMFVLIGSFIGSVISVSFSQLLERKH